MEDREALIPSPSFSSSSDGITSNFHPSRNRRHLYHPPHPPISGRHFAFPFGFKVIALIVLLFVSMQFVLNFSSYQHHFHTSMLGDSYDSAVPFRDGRKALSAASYFNLEDLEQKRLQQQQQSMSKCDNCDSSNILYSSLDSNSSQSSTNDLPICPLIPPKLVGPVKVLLSAPSFSEMGKMFDWLSPGGHYKPTECTARSRVAIIIPYRDREEHLRTLLHNLHPILKRQQIDYTIFVVEEIPDVKFNRAKLMNVGFVEALRTYDFQCFIFHDVDLIPEDDRNLYTCPTDQPRHMSVAVSTLNYRLPYRDIFGGVSALTKDMMVKVNGFSNEFWGWGAEDDDMANRIKYHGYKISRYRSQVARYYMLKHKKDTPNPDRYKKLYKGRQRFKSDGLSNLQYKVAKREFRKLYTWLLIDLMKDAS